MKGNTHFLFSTHLYLEMSTRSLCSPETYRHLQDPTRSVKLLYFCTLCLAICLSTSSTACSLGKQAILRPLPKRRGRPLRSASKPCVRLVTSHGSSILRSVVIDALRFVFRMPLVVTVAVKGTFVTEFFTTAFTFRGDMVDLYVIFLPEEKLTPLAFSLLFL